MQWTTWSTLKRSAVRSHLRQLQRKLDKALEADSPEELDRILNSIDIITQNTKRQVAAPDEAFR